MPLTDDQKDRLTEEAKRRGIDPGKLIAAAESSSRESGKAPSTDNGSTTEQPKLFMYLLPFVTVKEVREKWLGLTDSFPGDAQVASAWAAKQGGSSGDNEPPPEAA